MNSTTPLVDAAVNDTAFEDKNQPHTDWITAHAGREIEEKMNEARRELAHARDMLTVANETSAAADRIRSGLERELNESHAREAQLRAALDAPPHDTQHVECVCYSKNPTQVQVGYICNKCKALTLPAPPVVPVEDVKPLVDVITYALANHSTDGDGSLDRLEQALSTFTSKHKL